jgi:glutamate-5-semialdehyde dehydrogenase
MADLGQQIEELGQKARAAARVLALSSKDQKNAALMAMADALEASGEEILAANGRDLAAAPGYGLNAAAVDRL